MEEKRVWDLSAFGLRLIAMGAMLCDHLWATVISGNLWMTMVGRIAFPIFAFLIVEGFFHTRNVQKYALRLLIFALLSELPFNLVQGGDWFYPFGQNVMWTLLLGLLCLDRLEKLRGQHIGPKAGLRMALAILGFALAATVTLTDYAGYGVLTVVVFYAFRGNSWRSRLGQLVGLALINWVWVKGMTIPLAFGLELPIQGFAVLALLPIWCYRGRQGLHNRAAQLAFYAFYPVHLLILGLL